MHNHVISSNSAQGDSHNEVGGHGVAGTRHEGASQDTFWPSEGEELARPEVVERLGELYLLSDGVTRCADGYIASQLAVQTVRKHYYGQPVSDNQKPAMRLKRLQGAVWQAHRQLARWDEKFFCGQKKAHPRGKEAIYSRQELEQQGRLKDGIAYCPLCNKKMAGLQATLLAAVIHKRHLFLVGIGDSVALRIPADANQPISWLYKASGKKVFLGAPKLGYHKAGELPYWEKEFKTGDLIVLCCDGVIDTLQIWKGEMEWGTYLRQQLTSPSLTKVVPAFIKKLHDYRMTEHPDQLNDDLTMLAVRVSSNGPPTRPANRTLPEPQNSIKYLPEPDPVITAQVDSRPTPPGYILTEPSKRKANNYADPSNPEPIEAEEQPAVASQNGQITLLEWLGATYQEIITQLEQKNLHDAIRIAEQARFRQWLRHPSPDTLRQALFLLRGYEELAPEATTTAQNSLAFTYQEFSELLKKKFQFGMPEFEAHHPPTADRLIDYLGGVLKGRAPQFRENASVVDDSTATSTEPTKDKQNGRHNNDQPKDQPDEQNGRDDKNELKEQLDRQTATKMVRQAAKLAFQDGKLAEATQVMVEVASQHPDNYLLRKDWKKLWNDPNHHFKLHVDPFFMTNVRFYDLTRLANLLSMAAQIDKTLKLAVTFHPSDDKLQIAAKCLEELQTWPKKRQIQKDLPDEVWAIPLTVASKLAMARVQVSRNQWVNALTGLKNEPNKPPSPELRSARETYATVVWRSFLGFEVRELKREVALRLLERVEWLRRRSAWALALAEAEKLRVQGDIIEAACVAVKMPMPESLGIDEQDQVMKQQQAFVNQAWEIAYGMASGKLMLIHNQRLQSAINTLNKAELDQISGYYAVRMCAVHDLLRVFHYEQAKARVSAALICEKFTQYTQLTPLDYEQLLEIRLTRIDQVWGMAFQKAKSNRPIEREERGKLAGIAEKLSEAQDSQLIAAGLLLESALAFQADKRGEAAEQVIEAWHILENPNKDQVWQLADQIYLQRWDSVYFWQIGRRRQLERLRQLADDPRLSSVRSALIRRFDGKTARMRNEWLSILSVLILLLVVGPFLATIWGTDSTSANELGGSSVQAATPLATSPANITTVALPIATDTPIPTMTATPTDISPRPTEPSVNALATSQAQAVVATSQAQATITASKAEAAAEAAQTSAWTLQAGSPLGGEPVLIEMTHGEAAVRTLFDLVTYLGQEGENVADELVAMRTLTPNYPGDRAIKVETSLRGMLPADPLFLFVGQAAETPRMYGDDFGFWLNVADSSGNPPKIFVSVLENNRAQIENQPLDQGRWVWVLGSSKPLVNALLACRNSLVENRQDGINAYDCSDQENFVSGVRPINLKAEVLIGVEDGVLQEPLLENAIEDRWIYGDLGQDGLQLALPDEARHRISEPTSRVGLVRGSWDSDSNTIKPSNILARQDNGVYQPI